MALVGKLIVHDSDSMIDAMLDAMLLLSPTSLNMLIDNFLFKSIT